MIYLILLLMFPLIFLASSFPLFILLTKLEENGMAEKVFGILTIMFFVGGLLLWYNYGKL